MLKRNSFLNGMTEENAKISIIIPSFNRCDDLRRCLLSLRYQRGCRMEVIVVDDHSADETVHMIKAEFPEVRLFQNQSNLGPSYARNIGIIEATGSHILFLDSDTTIERPDVLTNFIRFFYKHPETGTLGGEISVFSGQIEQVFGRAITHDGNSKSVSVPNRDGSHAQCDFLATCCCMVRRELALRVGGFDPYYGFGGEDKDFGYRIKKLGFKNYVSADCAAKHYHSPKGRSTDETYEYHKTRIRFVLKFFPRTKALFAFLSWLYSIFAFYLILPVKLVVFSIKGKPVVKENVIGGFLLAKAFFQNVMAYKQIKATRSVNFLDPREMAKYVSSHKNNEA
jgi:GT2 family glycosyltransferase